MTQIEPKQIDALAAEVSRLYASLEDAGRGTLEALRETDPTIVEELIATFESEDKAARWLISRTIGFGGRSAVDLLAQGDREQVMLALGHLRYGFCA
ncbi:MbcA/ParS/Xre antitoxin family protein [Paraburkholderia sp. MM6662-R1]|uniref:MbcA/ParS/Xre antitoxin family protein n=1 Tax=Paraburkholderia sp. MM6662-R1 TaxID=2991066 RepID=UPI003D1F21FC